MKQENNDKGVGATAFDLPNSQYPEYENRIYHTQVKVPHPTNSAAKRVNPREVMSHVLEGK